MGLDFRGCAVRCWVLLAGVIIFSDMQVPVDAYLYNNRYVGDQVFRVTPRDVTEVQVLKRMLGNIKVDLWQPNSASLIRHNATVDMHVKLNDTQGLHAHLKQEGIAYNVFISNLQKEIEKQTGYRSARRRRSESHYDYEVYHSLEEIQSWMFEVNRTHPEIVDMFSIGTSYEGRPLYVLQIGKRSRPQKKAMWIDCGVHAREWIGPAFCQWFVKEVGLSGMLTFGFAVVILQPCRPAVVQQTSSSHLTNRHLPLQGGNVNTCLVGATAYSELVQQALNICCAHHACLWCCLMGLLLSPMMS